MGLANPGWARGRSSLLLFFPKLLILSGIPPFSTNLFQLAFLLSLLVGFNLSFLIAALAWSFKITMFLASLSRCFARIPSWPVLFSLFINDLPASLPSSVSCSFYADDLAIWSSSSSVHTAVVAKQGALFRLECWSEYWCLPLNLSKCDAFFFLVDLNQVHLQPNVLLLSSRLHFNPTPAFCGITFDCTLSFSKQLSLLKAKFFSRLKALCCISASSWGPL